MNTIKTDLDQIATYMSAIVDVDAVTFNETEKTITVTGSMVIDSTIIVNATLDVQDLQLLNPNVPTSLVFARSLCNKLIGQLNVRHLENYQKHQKWVNESN